MNVETIKRNIKSRLGEVRFGASRQLDDGRIRIHVETGREVTESMIQADFHSTYWETDKKYLVIAKPDGTVLSVDEE